MAEHGVNPNQEKNSLKFTLHELRQLQQNFQKVSIDCRPCRKMFVQKKGSLTGKSLWGFNLRSSLVNRNVQKNCLYTDINWNLRQNAIISNTFWGSERFMNPPSPMSFHLSIYDKESYFQYWRHKEWQIGHIFSWFNWLQPLHITHLSR